jgi:hypothetical protein
VTFPTKSQSLNYSNEDGDCEDVEGRRRSVCVQEAHCRGYIGTCLISIISNKFTVRFRQQLDLLIQGNDVNEISQFEEADCSNSHETAEK